MKLDFSNGYSLGHAGITMYPCDKSWLNKACTYLTYPRLVFTNWP